MLLLINSVAFADGYQKDADTYIIVREPPRVVYVEQEPPVIVRPMPYYIYDPRDGYIPPTRPYYTNYPTFNFDFGFLFNGRNHGGGNHSYHRR